MRTFQQVFALLVCSGFTGLLTNGQNIAEPLTNESIATMVSSGASTGTIIKTIQVAESVNFRFLPNDLAILQQAKVPDEVIKAMAAKAYGRTSSAAPPRISQSASTSTSVTPSGVSKEPPSQLPPVSSSSPPRHD